MNEKPWSWFCRRLDMAYYDTEQKNWRVEPGAFTIELAASSRDIRLSKSIEWIKDMRFSSPVN